MVGGKRKASSAGESEKKRKPITFETKVTMIKRVDGGERVADVARSFNVNRSTVATIYKKKASIMEHMKGAVPMEALCLSKKRGKVIQEMEKLLSIWINHQQQRRMPLSTVLIQEKAKSIFDTVKAKVGESARDETFSASNGWFNRYKKRANLHNVTVQGEAASADKMAAEGFPNQLRKIIEEGEYTAKQIFNCDETGLFYKKMPEKTYISKEEKAMPGFKVSKERITVMLGANADGTCKLKPLVVHR